MKSHIEKRGHFSLGLVISMLSGIEFSSLLRGIIRVALGAGVLLAIALLIWGGVQYVTMDTFANKDQGKERIQKALGGLVLLFTSFLILKLINPALISGDDLNIAQISIESQIICSKDIKYKFDTWNRENGGNWSVWSAKQYFDLHTSSDGKTHTCKANVSKCAALAREKNSQTQQRQNAGDNSKPFEHVLCLACDKEGKERCRVVVSHDTNNFPDEGSPNPEKDVVLSVYCRAYETDPLGFLGPGYEHRCVLNKEGKYIINYTAEVAEYYRREKDKNGGVKKECALEDHSWYGSYENHRKDCQNKLDEYIKEQDKLEQNQKDHLLSGCVPVHTSGFSRGWKMCYFYVPKQSGGASGGW